jgi:hypothetical protein
VGAEGAETASGQTPPVAACRFHFSASAFVSGLSDTIYRNHFAWLWLENDLNLI